MAKLLAIWLVLMAALASGCASHCDLTFDRAALPGDSVNLLGYLNDRLPLRNAFRVIGLRRIDGPRGVVTDEQRFTIDVSGDLASAVARLGIGSSDLRESVRLHLERAVAAQLTNPFFLSARYALDPIAMVNAMGHRDEVEGVLIERIVGWGTLSDEEGTQAALEADILDSVVRAIRAARPEAKTDQDRQELDQAGRRAREVAVTLAVSYTSKRTRKLVDAVDEIECRRILVSRARTLQLQRGARFGADGDERGWLPAGISVVNREGTLDLRGSLRVLRYDRGAVREVTTASEIRIRKGDRLIFAHPQERDRVFGVIDVLAQDPRTGEVELRIHTIEPAVHELVDRGLMVVRWSSWREAPATPEASATLAPAEPKS